MSGSLRWPLAIVITGALLAGLVVAGAEGPVRVALALWFVLICPGMSFAPLLPLGPSVAQLTFAVALSLAIGTAVTTAMLVVSGFSMTAGLLSIYAICLVGCGLQIRGWLRAQLPSEVRLLA